MQHAPELLFIIFYTFVCKKLSSCRLKFLGKIAGKYVGNIKQASGKTKAKVRAPKFVSRILYCVALVTIHFFFSEQSFYGSYMTLHSHTITVISHALAYSSRWLQKP